MCMHSEDMSSVVGFQRCGVEDIASSAKMRLSVVLWRFAGILLVSGTLDFNFFPHNRKYVPTSQINCYEYNTNAKFSAERLGRALNDWRTHNTAVRKIMTGSYSSPTNERKYNSKLMSRRSIDNLLPYKHDIFKEHAKLVQDINGLRQVVFVPPLVDDNKDYDESIFHDTIETFSTTSRPSTTNTNRPIKKSSIPVILVGGASSNKLVKSQPFSFPKSTISLVGTTGSPLLKHPYPFVVEEPQKPLRVCMPAMALSTTTHKPSLWERLLKTLIPR